MTVRLYKSTDLNAPILTGEADKLNLLLQTCLVTGYTNKPALGWSVLFTDVATRTNAFLMGGSNPHVLQVSDNGPGAGLAREARIRGYASMTSALVGTEPFPTTTQRSTALVVRKSSTASTVPRAWHLLASEQFFILLTQPGDTAGQHSITIFGKFNSYKPGDLYNSVIAARLVENIGTQTSTQEGFSHALASQSAVGNGYVLRSYTAVPGAVSVGFLADLQMSTVTASYPMGGLGVAYPMPVSGGLFTVPVQINEVNAIRGTLQQVYCPMHNRPLVHNDTWSAVFGLTQRDFEAWSINSLGQIVVETSNTWS